jgi:hypothetical protein
MKKIFNTLFIFRKLLVLSFCLIAFSCAKKPQGVRAQVKTQQNNLSPQQSAQATQQAAAISADYTFLTLSLPKQIEDSNGFSIDLELQIPGGKILPITTKHENGNLFSEGVYNDTERNNLVHIQANCSSNNCEKYTVLVTVYKNNNPVFETFAVSFANDCRFNVVSTSYSNGNFFKYINQAENSYMNVAPLNDISTCME